MSILQEIIQKSIFLGDLQRIKGLGVIPILTEATPEIPALQPLETALKRARPM